MRRTPDTAHTQFPGRIGRTLANAQPWWPQPWWPDRPQRKPGTPNILIVLFDDVGFSDFGCYGSTIPTPTINAIDRAGPAHDRLSYHRDVLDHPCRDAHRTQPSRGRHGLFGQF